MAVPIPVLGRRRFAEGQITAPAAGNSAVTTDVRGSRAARPGAGGAMNGSPIGGLELITPPSLLNKETYARPTQNNRLVARDRHIISRRGRTATSADRQQPSSGIPNPEADGPAPPAYEQINRTLSWQVGTDHTTNLDNDAPHASTSAGGRRFPLGNQGSQPWDPVYGGTPGLYRPYGARGFVVGPAARQYALPGGPYRPGTVLSDGEPGDGPQRVSGGAPHGLHSPTSSILETSAKRFRAVPQMVPGRSQRPAGSRIAGQSYSMTVVGQDGRGGGRLPRMNGGRRPGVNGRFGR